MKNKNILLGITGGIAAYKAAILLRALIKEGSQVKEIMTTLAKEFIGPLTLATLSKNPILVDFFDPENGQWNSHVDLGQWADLYLIAPATANSIAKMANGIADNLLLTSYLSAKCKVMLAPAMDLDMYKHPATRNNIEILKLRGNIIVEPESGELASGLIGKGRMAEPEAISQAVKQFFATDEKFVPKKIMITAGPTYEPIDPVRFIGNYSSGKMGYALAEELANRGAQITLISGPVSIKIKNNNIKLIQVKTAAEMYEASLKKFPINDAAILAAAVSDYRPEKYFEKKMKRSSNDLEIKLIPNKDIAAELGKIKTEQQILAGFALETNDETENAIKKMQKKNFDFIVLNSMNDSGAGFNFDTNKIYIITKNNKIYNYELKSKAEVAIDISNKLSEYF